MISCFSLLGFYVLLCDWCSVLILAAISDVDQIWEGDDPSDMPFQQVERASLNFHIAHKDFLDRKLPQKCLSGCGPITWPLPAPDLTNFIYFPAGMTFQDCLPIFWYFLWRYVLLHVHFYTLYLQTCKLKSDRYVPYLALLVVPSCNICKSLRLGT